MKRPTAMSQNTRLIGNWQSCDLNESQLTALVDILTLWGSQAADDAFQLAISLRDMAVSQIYLGRAKQ